MKHLLTIIIGSIIVIAIFMTMDWKDIDLSFSLPSDAGTTSRQQPVSDMVYDDQSEFEEDIK